MALFYQSSFGIMRVSWLRQPICVDDEATHACYLASPNVFHGALHTGLPALFMRSQRLLLGCAAAETKNACRKY